MKLVKTSAIALAVSAMLAGPVLAQGTSSDKQIRSGTQSKTNMQQGGAGSSDEELDAQTGTSGEKAGVNTKSGTRGTVGSNSGASKSNSGASKSTGGAASDPATGGKRY